MVGEIVPFLYGLCKRKSELNVCRFIAAPKGGHKHFPVCFIRVLDIVKGIVKKHTPIKSLLIDWLIIFGTYLFIRIFFALFGLHQNIVLLGCCLAILPYLFGALYLQKSHKQCQLWLAALAILIPSVVEKAAIYLFGAYLYNLRPINVVGVMEAIKSNAPYTNFIKNQSAQNLINLSYFNWTYILCSIAISVLVILLLHKTKQKSNKG